MWIKASADSAILACRVHPNSGRDSIKEIRNGRLVIHLRARAVEGKANEALITFLSDRLKVPKSRISLIQGDRNRNKVVAIEGRSPQEIELSLGLNQ
jgi:uncharacterized protein (TIGR00251 family)